MLLLVETGGAVVGIVVVQAEVVSSFPSVNDKY